MHQGVMKDNGIVDIAKVITDPVKLQTTLSDDGLHLDNFNPGNFEWWYFDIIDPDTNCILKMIAHLGTDPLRRNFFPQIAVSVKTPSSKKSIIQKYPLNQFAAERNACSVRIAEQFNCYVHKNNYHIVIDIPGFSGKFTYNCDLPGWKPFGDEVSINKKRRHGAFGWVVPVPGASVTGFFTVEGQTYQLKNASGYHDHNFWKIGQAKRLFIDEVISKWYWGRFKCGNNTIIFMNTHFSQNQLTSLYIAEGKNLIHSSNNSARFHIDRKKNDTILQCSYPEEAVIKTTKASGRHTIILKTREVIDRKDLLEGIHPIISFLIKLLVAKPAYIGLEVTCDLLQAGQTLHGRGIFEFMLFR